VLSGAGLTLPATRAVGRSARHLDFGRALSRDEAERAAAKLRADPQVEWVVANERERRLQVAEPNDSYFASQWWLQNPGGSNASPLAARLRGVAGFQNAWGAETGLPGAVVAVLDTGITDHPDLVGHVLPGYDFVSTVEYANDGDGRDPDPSDPGDWVTRAEIDRASGLFAHCSEEPSSWHGTEIAGMVAAVTNNASGIAATSWNGRVLPVRVAGKCGADLLDIIDGMRWAAGLAVARSGGGFLPINPNPARVVSISFGSSANCNAAYQATIDELAALGVVVVAAAGNQHGAPTRPANCRGVVGVVALNRDGFKATYSSFGPTLGIATVGGDPGNEGAWGPALGDDGLITLDNSGLQAPAGATYARVFGSSFSAPVVAGAIGLMLSANPGLTHAQIFEGLRLSARPHVTSPSIGACSAANPGRCVCTTSTCGAGILDAPEAVRYAQALLAGEVFTPKRWPTEVIDNAEVDAAVALGPDLPQDSPVVVASGGGGALGLTWLLALALATVCLFWVERRQRR